MVSKQKKAAKKRQAIAAHIHDLSKMGEICDSNRDLLLSNLVAKDAGSTTTSVELEFPTVEVSTPELHDPSECPSSVAVQSTANTVREAGFELIEQSAYPAPTTVAEWFAREDEKDRQMAAEGGSAPPASCSSTQTHDGAQILHERVQDHARLFTWCKKCRRLDMCILEGQYIPSDLVPEGEELENAIIMTLCGNCSGPAAQKKKGAFGFNDASGSDGKFIDMGMSKDLMDGVMVYQVAKLIVGKNVPLIGRMGELVFVEMKNILKELGVNDVMASLDLSQVSSNDKTRVVLPHLKLGLL